MSDASYFSVAPTLSKNYYKHVNVKIHMQTNGSTGSQFINMLHLNFFMLLHPENQKY